MKRTMNISSLQKSTSVRCGRIQAFILLTLAFVHISAFQVSTTGTTYHKPACTALQAWSLPLDTTFTFRTWYDEYNPTARVTVYNDPDPIERYTFMTIGNDWPSMLDSSSVLPQPSNSSPERNANPIKRAWRRRGFRRVLAAARRSFRISKDN